jgi:hypothetical protein
MKELFLFYRLRLNARYQTSGNKLLIVFILIIFLSVSIKVYISTDWLIRRNAGDQSL